MRLVYWGFLRERGRAGDLCVDSLWMIPCTCTCQNSDTFILERTVGIMTARSTDHASISISKWILRTKSIHPSKTHYYHISPRQKTLGDQAITITLITSIKDPKVSAIQHLFLNYTLLKYKLLTKHKSLNRCMGYLKSSHAVLIYKRPLAPPSQPYARYKHFVNNR